MMIYWYVLLVIFILFLSTRIYSFRTEVPTVASFPAARRKVIEIFEKIRGGYYENFRRTDYRSGIRQRPVGNKIARAFPNTKVIGMEISIVPWMISCLRQKLFGPRQS